MVWSTVKIKRQHDYEGISFRNSGLYWNAKFITAKRLENFTDVEFKRDSDNPFLLGFTFHKSPTKASLQLQKAGRGDNSAGRMVKASALRKFDRLIDAECKSKADPFPILYDKYNQIYYVELRPNFTNKIRYADMGSLPSDIKGIYRYKDRQNSIIYIGKGNIKERALQEERRNWSIESIEYGVVDDDEQALEWESHYIDEYRQNNGYLPPFNRVRGQSKK